MNERLHKWNPAYGPLQIVHDFQFVALNVKDDYSPLAAMSPAEKADAICKRIDTLHARNYGGIVLNVDYENYLRREETYVWLEKAMVHAKSLGMRVWIYDEQYYPSGGAGGLVLENHPEYEGICLACVTRDFTATGTALRIASPHGYSGVQYAIAAPLVNGEPDHSKRQLLTHCTDLAGGFCWDAPAGDWRVWVFFTRVLYELTYACQGTRAIRRYPDIMNPDAMARFMEVTFTDGYEKHLPGPLCELAEAVFTDEPRLLKYQKYTKNPADIDKTRFPSHSVFDRPDLAIPMLPYIYWQPAMPDLFRQMYGYDLVEALPDLFENTAATAKVRLDYHRMLDGLVKESCLGTMKKYLHARNVQLSGHYLYEEELGWHPHLYGDLLAHLGTLDIPGCDLLMSATDKLRYSTSLKAASSAAHIYHKDHVMMEASNMVDKDQTMDLPRLTAAIAIMYSHGIDTITSYYGENLLPPEDMARFGRFTAKLGSVLEGGQCQVDTLLFYPFEELCVLSGPEAEAGILSGTFGMDTAAEVLLSRQIGFDMINIDCAERCVTDATGLVTDYGQRVWQIVLPDIPLVTARTNDFLTRAAEAGVVLYAAGEPRVIEGLTVPVRFLVEEAPVSTDVTLDAPDPYISLLHKSYPDGELYLLVNTENVDKTIGLRLPDCGKLTILDPLAETVAELPAMHEKDATHATLNLPGYACRVICQE